MKNPDHKLLWDVKAELSKQDQMVHVLMSSSDQSVHLSNEEKAILKEASNSIVKAIGELNKIKLT